VIRLFELCGLLAVVYALVIVQRRPPHPSRSVRMSLTALLGMLAFNHVANLLEASGLVWADTIADQLSLMVPVLWGLFLLETGRTYMHARLRASDDQVRFFLESVPASVAWLDAQRRLLGFSAAWKSCFPTSEPGVQLESALPLPLPLLATAIEHSLRGEDDADSTEETVETSDGERRHFRWSTRPWRHPDREQLGVLLLLEEVTADREGEARRLLAAEELARTQRLADVGQLAAGAAHDFNNFLQIIHAATWELDAEPQLRQAAIANIQQALGSAEEMTRAMLHFGSGQTSPAAPVDLSSLLRSMQGPIAHALGRKHRLELSLPDAPSLIVWGSATRLQQALLNLAINARDAMPRGGAIELAATVDGGEVVLSVHDSGTGMPESVQSRLFTPFFTTKGARGTGLGLRVVRSAVEEHKGRVSVESEPGVGTTFRLRLPLFDAHSSRAG
jgi:PAS domain S-box-containing protein